MHDAGGDDLIGAVDAVESSPPSVMEPSLADKRPEMVFSSVVLPWPFGPMIGNEFPSPTSSDRPASTG